MSSFENPVVRGHAPDPSVVRVGNDFYLATSSFGFMPGIPIRHSTDLVHWRTIGFAITRPEQYRRDGRPGKVVLFAPTLRFHDGIFYLVCTNPADGQGNFMVTTTDPAGEWSDAIWLDRESFDPSLFRDDDGKWFYTRRDLRFLPDGNLGPIVQTEIDIQTGALGELREISPGNRGFSSNDIEGPHLFRRGEWYYLSAAEGSSWQGHMQTVGRSRSPWGPFEPAPNNPILSHRNRTAHPIQTLGHAELIEAPDGRWWALSLGTRQAKFSQHHNLGRETFLTPMRWSADGWPIVGNNGETELEFGDVTLPSDAGTEFTTEDTLWSRGWSTLGAPDSRLDAITGAEGRAIELPFGATPGDAGRPVGALFTPQTEYAQRFSTVVETVVERCAVGVAVWVDTSHYYQALVTRTGATRRIDFRRLVDDLDVSAVVDLEGEDGPIELSIRSGVKSYAFEAQVNGRKYELGAGAARLLSAEAAEWFVNANFTLLAIGSHNEKTPARFSSTTLETLPTEDIGFTLQF
jgi:xylan 1,4-beta-xylosidase